MKCRTYYKTSLVYPIDDNMLTTHKPIKWMELSTNAQHVELIRTSTKWSLSTNLYNQETYEPNRVTVNQTVSNQNCWNWMLQMNRWNQNWTESEPSELELGVYIDTKHLNKNWKCEQMSIVSKLWFRSIPFGSYVVLV